MTNTGRYRILTRMAYQSVSDRAAPEDGHAAEAAALAWLEQRLRFEAWLERVREQPGPEPGSGLAAAA